MKTVSKLRTFIEGESNTLYLSRKEVLEVIRVIDSAETLRQESKRFRTIVDRVLGDG